VKPLLTAFGAGLLFALGLGVGGMTSPAKVRAFLDVTGDWDASLLFVMAGALGTHALLRRLIVRARTRPVLAPAFPDASSARVDARLLAGAAVFGVGWGLVGYCPGPAFTALATGSPVTWAFVAAMLAGMLLFRLWERRAVPARAAPVASR
jgi:uncharacterized membrane protein YedE/YeeE